MRRVISFECPETEPEKRPEDGERAAPASIPAMLEAADRQEEAGEAEQKPPKRLRICNDKNAAPGDGARSSDKCLDDMRPRAICVDRSAQSASDPATQRECALQNWGELRIHAGSGMIPQFETT